MHLYPRGVAESEASVGALVHFKRQTKENRYCAELR
jgi:hypothetical protein